MTLAIIAVPQPKFYLNLTHDVVKAIIKCADNHYDFTCRRQSQPGGFLYGWFNMTMPSEEVDVCESKCSASWSDSDTLLKILENPYPMSDVDTLAINNLRECLSAAVRIAQEQMSKMELMIGELPMSQQTGLHKFGLLAKKSL